MRVRILPSLALSLQEETKMVELYVKLIKDGLFTLEDVPVLWRAEVQGVLDAEK